MTSRQFSVCLFCGSRSGGSPEFALAARALGVCLADRGHKLVYGAGDGGLMGEAARAMHAAGGRILGVIPGHLTSREGGTHDFEEHIVTGTMHERKKLMFDRSDGVIALPGGPGTLDELIEVLTWRQLGLHEKPVVLVNIGGYWDLLLNLLDHMIAQGFAERRFRSFLTVETDAESAVNRVETLLTASTNPAV